jgi:hypothetical protein
VTLAEKIISFYGSLSIDKVPRNIEVMNPFSNMDSFPITKKFYYKYYDDELPRTMILGINPGRFGGGVTGVPFTDPIKLEKECGIPNDLSQKTDLSADFIYRMINNCGGPAAFYNRFYISAVSPLGFTKNGKNANYYDMKELQDGLQDFIVSSLQTQINFGMNTEVCFCLGEGLNFKFLSKLNIKYKFFEKIIPLAHPRFIMQYRRKKIDFYISDYVEKFNQ